MRGPLPRRAAVMTFAAMFLAACSEPAPPAEPPEDAAVEGLPPAEEEEEADDGLLYEHLFDLDTIQQVFLTISASDQEALAADGTTYVPATLVHDGATLANVGVRIKGSSTLQPWDGKPSLKVKLNAFVEDQRYAGLETLTLNNMVQDDAQATEVLAYRLYELAEQLAPRANFAQVWVRDEEGASYEGFGLYTNVETVDERFLEHRDLDLDGTLWEANDGSDITEEGVANFELAWGEDDRSRLYAAAAALEQGLGDEHVDLDQFTRFWAWALATANSDGYPASRDDFFVFDDPEDERFDFVPWGLDETWNRGVDWNLVDGELGQACLADASCLAALKEHTREALAVCDEAASLLDELYVLTEEAVAADTRRPAEIDVEDGREELADDLEDWPDELEGHMGL